MQLGKFTDFGLRVMVHLAVTYPAKTSVQQIAKTFDVSEHHLAKICSQLVKAGFVTSSRGRSGGLSLAKPPDAFTLGEIAAALVEGIPFIECAADGECHCLLAPACGLRGPLFNAQAAFFNELNKTSLKEAIGDPFKTRSLLSI